jgi:hypothetical protein
MPDLDLGFGKPMRASAFSPASPERRLLLTV